MKPDIDIEALKQVISYLDKEIAEKVAKGKYFDLSHLAEARCTLALQLSFLQCFDLEPGNINMPL